MTAAFARPMPAAVRWGLVASLLVLASCPVWLAPFPLRVVQQVLLFGGMAVAWAMFCGPTGYWSFGHTAFVGIGAFAAGLAEPFLGPGAAPGLRLATGLGAAAAITAVAALLMARPVLRLRGVYFAIGMLCFAEILSEASRNIPALRGTMGFGLPGVPLFGLNRLQSSYLTVLALFALAVTASILLRRSRLGLGLLCIGQDEDTAAMMGIRTERCKVVAFVASAVLTALFGVPHAHGLGFITSDSVFRTDISLNMIVFSMVGGVGHPLGPPLGALLMVFATQVLLGGLLNMHLMFTGLILVATVLAAPDGLLGLLRRRR